jgi:DNA repair protein RadC
MRYAVRLDTKLIREKDFPYSGADLSGTKQVVEFARSLQDSDVEKFLVLYLNARNKLNCISVQMGTVNQAVVYPREIVKHCILSNACAVILVHNHPSGHVRPSEQDIRLTRSLSEVCRILDIQLHDHIIMGNGNHYSFREDGMI